MVLLDWKQISYPYLDADMPVLDAVLQRAKTEGVKTVIAAGEIIYQDGKFTKVDRDAALRQLSELLKRPLNPDEIERRQLSKAVFRTSNRSTTAITTPMPMFPITGRIRGSE